MRIMMFIRVPGDTTLNNKIVTGGTEQFAKLMADHNESIIPVQLTTHSEKRNNTKRIIEHQINKYNPDILLSHSDNKTLTLDLLTYNIPHIWVYNTPNIRTIIQYSVMQHINDYINLGGNLFFVSEYQHDYVKKLCKRITGNNLLCAKGYINPCFSHDNWKNSDDECEYDVVTVGRNVIEKNPFILHKKSEGTGLKSLVITNSDNFMNYLKNNDYSKRNTHWKFPQDTVYNLPHTDVITTMKKAKVFVSTMPQESWGITALEALCNGLPCIFLTDDTDRHASELIADRKDDYRLLRKNCSKQDFLDCVRELSVYAEQNRSDISFRHRKKHSKEKWIKSIDDMFTMIKTQHTSNSSTLYDFLEV